MHQAFVKIASTIEGIAAHIGLGATAKWDEVDGSLRGTLTVKRPSGDATDYQKKLTELIFKAQEFATVSSLTVDSTSGDSEGEYFVILQIVSDVHLDQIVKSGKLDSYCKSLTDFFEHELTERRRKRNRNELPDPDRSPQAHVNRNPRTTKQFKVDVAPELSERIDAFRRATGMSKREITEAALQAYLDQQEPK